MSIRTTFLGTGAGGSIHRAHTAIAFECDDDTRLLLDASSGNTVARNCVQLGMAPESFHKVLLTHHHADHMSGLPLIQLVHTRSLDDGPPLEVYGPADVLHHAEYLCQVLSPNLKVDREGAMNPEGRQVMRWHNVEAGSQIQLGSSTFASCFSADHIPGAVGWTIDSGGVRVVFSGDTRFNPVMAEAGHGAHLLIHEAYALDRDQEHAAGAGHSTAGEAGRIAALAGAEELVITHVTNPFHHQPHPLINEASEHFPGPVSVAFDLRQLTVTS